MTNHRTTAIIERLKAVGEAGDNVTYPSISAARRIRALVMSAAHTIAASEAENERLQVALREIAKHPGRADDATWSLVDIARAALNPQGTDQ